MYDYNTTVIPQKSVVSIKWNVPEFNQNQIIFSRERPILQNENFKLFDGICEGNGNVTILTLYSYRKNREQFFRWITGINVFLNLNSPYWAKLLGFFTEDLNFNLIFEHLVSSISSKLFTFNEYEKYDCLYNMILMISTMHQNNYQCLDIKPTNIFWNEDNQIKIIFPIDNLNLFREELDEDDDIWENLINNDDTLIRFTAPEKWGDVPVWGNVNDIWMLGCLMIELFSKEKVWDGYTENEIVKQLKTLQTPKVPRDIPQVVWNIICECLNPFYKARSNIRDILEHYKSVLNKVNRNDIIIKYGSGGGHRLNQHNISNANLNASYHTTPYNTGVNNNNNNNKPNQIASNYNNNNNNDKYSRFSNNNTSVDKTQQFEDDYQIRRCYIHPKFIIDSYCTKCNELVCSKCISDKKHISHTESILEMHDYINNAINQVQTFLTKFKTFVTESSKNFPIDDSIKEYIYKQKNILDNWYNEHLNFINIQFNNLHKKIEDWKKIEIENLNNFRSFFASKLDDFSTTISELSSEADRIENEINAKLQDYQNFPRWDTTWKSEIIKTIPCDKEILKENKVCIMNKFKDYQKQISVCDKVKRYFQRAVLNWKDNKVYQLTSIWDKLQTQLEATYSKWNWNEYLKNIIVDIDNYALINSRNYIPSNIQEIFIACFKSKKVWSYNISTNILSITEADFNNNSNKWYEQFPNFSRSININGWLYVNGGYDELNKKSLRAHWMYNPQNLGVTQCNNMIYGHSAHSLIFIPPSFIYVVSGSAMPKCEKYDMNTNIWEEVPSINYHRQNCSWFYHNEQYWYSFGGWCFDESWGEFIFVETVERWDIGFMNNTSDNKWEIVPTIKNKGNVNISKSIMSVVPIHPNKILWIGGLFKDQSYSDEVILFDFEKSEFSLCEDVRLEKKTCFPSKFFLFQGDFAYQFDNDGDIHEFNIKECLFRMVSQHQPGTG